MKKALFGILMLLSIQLNAQQLQVLSSTRSFRLTNDSLYLENILKIYGQSIEFADSNQKAAQLQIQYLLQEANTKKLIWADNILLNTPQCIDNICPDFQTIEKIRITKGHYLLNISIINTSSPTDTVILIDDLNVNPSALSDAQLILSKAESNDTSNPFYKQGFIVEPFPDAFYPETIQEINFYLEAYSFEKIDSFYKAKVVYGIKPKNNTAFIPQTAVGKRISINTIHPIFGTLNIENLPTGNYAFCIELYNELGELMAEKQIEFQRFNNRAAFNPAQFKNINTQHTFVELFTVNQLNEYLEWLRPISTQQEIFVQDNLLKSDNTDEKKQYFYYYWEQKDFANPKSEWEKYALEVEKVNQLFGNKFIKGYTTDRGRVYLQYGAPNLVNKNDYDRNVFPYEIWHYFAVQNQRNRRFVFSLNNRSLANEDYQLIHSDMRGEVFNPQWKNVLQRKQISPYDLNQNNNNVPRNRYFGDDVLDRDFD